MNVEETEQYWKEAYLELSQPTSVEEANATGRCEYFLRIDATLAAERELIEENHKLRLAEIERSRRALYYDRYDQFVRDFESLPRKGKAKSITFQHGKAGTRMQPDGLAIIDQDTYIDWVQDNILAINHPTWLKTVITPYKTPLTARLKVGGFAENGIPAGTEFVPAHDKFFPANINKDLKKEPLI